MKKRFVFVLVVLVLCSVGFAACANVNQAILSNISEVYHGVYEGETEGKVSVKVITGEREKNFAMDGKSGVNEGFTTIAISPDEGFAVTEEQKYTYKFAFEGKDYEGELVIDKVSGKPKAELKLNMGNMPEFALSITAGEQTVEVPMKTVMGTDIITYTDALDLAKLEFKADIEALYKNGKLDAEIYIRYVAGSDKSSTAGGENKKDYFWYVAFLTPEKKSFAVLIDPVNSAILTKKAQD